MNLDHLELFLRIMETGSVSAAARAVHLTQPAVSRTLRRLEDDLGTLLFERKGRGIVPTPAARALAPRARALLVDARSVARDVQRAAERRYADIRIGTVDSVATYLFPEVVEPLRQAFPDLQVKLHTARTARLLQLLDARELDVAIIASSGPPIGREAVPLGRYDLQFYGRADLFPGLSDAVTDEDVMEFPMVEIEQLAGQPTMIPDGAPSFAVANSLASVKALVLAGFGVGALLHFMLGDDESERLVRAAVPHDPDCRLFLLPSLDWSGTVEGRIQAVVGGAISAAL